MISRFVNLFKKSDLDEQRAFQSRVAVILKTLHPEIALTKSDDPLVLEYGEQQLGLTNIRANFLLTTGTEQDLVTLVAEHFDQVFTGLDVDEMTSIGWEAARGQLMPQLVPESFLKKLPLEHAPFGGGILIGFVIDSEKTYRYVSENDRERWDVSSQDIYDAAIENLGLRSDGIKMNGVPGSNGLVVINTMDGFDAARILLPELRDYFASVINYPFFFGVPNRDFLIGWNANGDADFQKNMKIQIASDFETRPYPLSPMVFEVGETGDIHESTGVLSQIDPRTLVAGNN